MKLGAQYIKEIANETINSKLESVKPSSLNLEFYIDFPSHKPLEFMVGLRDSLSGHAPVHLRGAGYQKLIRLLFALLTIDEDSEHVVITFDEPENSLHADAQHSLSAVLSSVAQGQRLQVVYATHSPAMIIPNCPKSLRLLTRTRSDDGVATTRINNKPYSESNYQSVRAQLGILPVDSLMFASVTIIVEGPTERLALNRLIGRLIDESTLDIYSDLNLLWRLSFVLSAGGTGEIPKWTKLANSQGVRTIVLVDGDTSADKIGSGSDFDDVPIISHNYGKDFEEIVQRAVYFRALAKVLAELGKPVENITEEEFDKWWANAGLSTHMMFSRQVGEWLKSQFETCLDKPRVMDKAIEIANLDDIDLAKIDDLIDEIRKLEKEL